MKKEYDFSKAQKGKFHRKGATLRLPIYLDVKLQEFFEAIADCQGTDLGSIVNKVIRIPNGNRVEKCPIEF